MTDLVSDRPTHELVAGVDTADADAPFPTVRQRLSRWGKRQAQLLADDPGRAAEAGLAIALVALGTALVLATLHPDLLWKDTTPTGGDMGAHVWGPRYLLDHLLPKARLSGWSPDWYDGFPAYQFYMVIPSLLIVILHVGFTWLIAIPVVLVSFAAVALAWMRPRLYPYRRIILGLAVSIAVLSVPLSYNRSFKLVTAIGLLGIPVACWAFAKLADLPFPIPPLASVAGLVFLYNREPVYNNTGNIIGGNFQSTMAGEFAFSISLTVAILYLGVALRGLRTGRYRALAAGLFALAGLCHLIPAFFVLACTGAMFLVHPDKARLRWLATMVPVAGLLTAFWVLPFWWRRDYVNDMGWERLPVPNANIGEAAQKMAGNQQSVVYYLFPTGLKWLLVAGAVGVVVSLIRRYTVGLVLALAWAGVMVGFWHMPQYRLWNARLLPFMYLSVSLLAAIGVGELIRMVGIIASGRVERPLRAFTVTGGLLVGLATLVYVALPVQALMEGSDSNFGVRRQAVTIERQKDDGTPFTETVTESSVVLFGRSIVSTTVSNPVAGWSEWNYRGLELKEPTATSGGWPEYRDLMATMAAVGKNPELGCGRAFWEYDGDRLNGYGTPMAPMLLPYWTDGCIGSQEGLYFESSTTVPYHFLMQAELSAKPSSPQRGLPYPTFDIDAGVRHLQLLGVRYYLAVTDTAVQAAANQPDLTEVAVSGPWHVYEVANSELVSPLPYQPEVVTGVGESQDDWLPTASSWMLGGDLDVPLAIDGPTDWKRVAADPVPTEWRHLVRWTRDQLGLTGPMDQVPTTTRTALPPVEVSNIQQGDDSVSFSVSKPGVPVLVKVSYFPNWTVSGGEGPYRVTPNLMVVIPTDTHVTLSYGRTPPDLIGAALSLLGIIGLVLLARRPVIAVPSYTAPRASRWLDRQLLRPEVEQQRKAAIRRALATRQARPTPPGTRRLTVVIPAYGEAERIADSVERVRRELADHIEAHDLEIVVVDDGSDDGTAAAARRSSADQVIELPRNRGKGGAVAAGVAVANGRAVAFTDADLAYAPVQILRLLESVEAGWDMVVGSRHHHQTTTVVAARRLRDIGGRVINAATRLVLVGGHDDTQCGLKAFRSDVAALLFEHTTIDGFAFDIELFFLAERYGLSVTEVPVDVENSDSSTVRVAQDAVRLLADLVRIRRNDRQGRYEPAPGGLDRLTATGE